MQHLSEARLPPVLPTTSPPPTAGQLQPVPGCQHPVDRPISRTGRLGTWAAGEPADHRLEHTLVLSSKLSSNCLPCTVLNLRLSAILAAVQGPAAGLQTGEGPGQQLGTQSATVRVPNVHSAAKSLGSREKLSTHDRNWRVATPLPVTIPRISACSEPCTLRLGRPSPRVCASRRQGFGGAKAGTMQGGPLSGTLRCSAQAAASTSSAAAAANLLLHEVGTAAQPLALLRALSSASNAIDGLEKVVGPAASDVEACEQQLAVQQRHCRQLSHYAASTSGRACGGSTTPIPGASSSAAAWLRGPSAGLATRWRAFSSSSAASSAAARRSHGSSPERSFASQPAFAYEEPDYDAAAAVEAAASLQRAQQAVQTLKARARARLDEARALAASPSPYGEPSNVSDMRRLQCTEVADLVKVQKVGRACRGGAGRAGPLCRLVSRRLVSRRMESRQLPGCMCALPCAVKVKPPAVRWPPRAWCVHAQHPSMVRPWRPPTPRCSPLTPTPHPTALRPRRLPRPRRPCGSGCRTTALAGTAASPWRRCTCTDKRSRWGTT